MSRHINKNILFGALILLPKDATGEIVTSEGVSFPVRLNAGVNQGDYWHDILSRLGGESLVLPDTATLVPPRHRVGVVRAPAYTDSGANPDFSVTDESRRSRRMEIELMKLQDANARIERKLAAADQVGSEVKQVLAEKEPEADLLEPDLDDKEAEVDEKG